MAKDFETFIKGLITEAAAAELEEAAEARQAEELEKNEPEDFMEKLAYWHQTCQFHKINETIVALPESEKTFILKRKRGSALNNMYRYEDALEQLKEIEEEGKNDLDWNYIIAYSYLHLDEPEKALSYLKKAREIDPNDEDVLELIEEIENELEEKED